MRDDILAWEEASNTEAPMSMQVRYSFKFIFMHVTEDMKSFHYLI
jgi:hypothetical protein